MNRLQKESAEYKKELLKSGVSPSMASLESLAFENGFRKACELIDEYENEHYVGGDICFMAVSWMNEEIK